MNINELPPGGHTIEGLLSRSDPDFGKRMAHLGGKKERRLNTSLGLGHTAQLAKEDTQRARQNRQNLEHQFAETLGRGGKIDSSLQLQLDALSEKERQAEANERRNDMALRPAIQSSSDAGEVFANCTRYVAQRKTDNELIRVPVSIELPTGMTIMRAIGERSGKLAELREEETALDDDWHVPSGDFKRMLGNRLEAAAARGRTKISGLGGGGRSLKIEFPMKPSPFEPSTFLSRNSEARLNPQIIDVEALVARYFGPQIIAELEAEVDEFYLGVPPEKIFDVHEREKLKRALKAKIAKTERELAELLWMAVEEGHDPDFPPDLPAAAILGAQA